MHLHPQQHRQLQECSQSTVIFKFRLGILGIDEAIGHLLNRTLTHKLFLVDLMEALIHSYSVIESEEKKQVLRTSL